MGPVPGVRPGGVEFCEGKLAGWKRGREGSLRAAAVPDECWRPRAPGRIRRLGFRIERESILGDSGDEVDMLFLPSAGRRDMWWGGRIGEEVASLV